MDLYLNIIDYQYKNQSNNSNTHIHSLLTFPTYIPILYRLSILFITYCTISLTSANAPLPKSPHIILLGTGPTTSYPHSYNLLICSLVIGCSHMYVFIDGHTIIGFCYCVLDLMGHALQTRVSRLSHCPVDSLANV